MRLNHRSKLNESRKSEAGKEGMEKMGGRSSQRGSLGDAVKEKKIRELGSLHGSGRRMGVTEPRGEV